MNADNATSNTTRAFLRAGLAEVHLRPWIQHATRRESDGGVCAVGALFAAQVTARRLGHPVDGACLLDAHDRLERAASETAGESVTVPMFNDQYATTKVDIIRLYEKAISECP